MLFDDHGTERNRSDRRLDAEGVVRQSNWTLERFRKCPYAPEVGLVGRRRVPGHAMQQRDSASAARSCRFKGFSDLQLVGHPRRNNERFFGPRCKSYQRNVHDLARRNLEGGCTKTIKKVHRS